MIADAELIELLGGDGAVSALAREPYAYATSAPLERLELVRPDGRRQQLILKDLTRERLLGAAPRAKPLHLAEPRRELLAYSAILAPAGIGPRPAAVDLERRLLVVDKVDGVELWQVGELQVWQAVAAWLARMHARFAGSAAQLRAANPYLLELDGGWFRAWAERAVAALRGSDDPRAAPVRAALGHYEPVCEALAALPRTLVHGEFFPSNVLVSPDEPGGVVPVDWELAGIGPGLLDLAALVSGWDDAARNAIAGAYPGADRVDLARCRLHVALQQLGWAPDWRPPPEHEHDWLADAAALVEELALA